MDSEDKRTLEKILSLTEENNSMLHKVRSVQKTAQMFRAIYWVIILGSVLGAFYFVKPYLDSILGLYTGLSGVKDKSGSFQIPDAKQLQQIIKDLQGTK